MGDTAHVSVMDQKTISPLPYVMLSEEQVADLLGVSIRTVQGWRSKNRKVKGPKFVKVGGRIRYRSTAISEWLDEQETDEIAS